MAATSNLRVENDSFVGRGEVLDQLERVVSDGQQVIVIKGTAGVGKTRLALHFARMQLAHPESPVPSAWWVDLTPARTASDLCSAIAGALGVTLEGSGSDEATVAALTNALVFFGNTLLVLDNFEQLSSEADSLVARWSEAATLCTFVITSRRILAIESAHTIDLEPLSCPASSVSSAAEIFATEAVDLFVQRVRANIPEYATTDDGEHRVASAIVQALDGIPLAIELCAARMGILDSVQVLQKLEARRDFFRAAAPHDPRHATMVAAIEWSWAQLSAAEQAAFAQCSIFVGGFSLEAAEHVVRFDGTGSVAEVVRTLRDKSLLRERPSADGAKDSRFGMYDSIRTFAAEKLAQGAEHRATRDRHAQYYAARALEWSHPKNESADATHLLICEKDNLLAIVESSFEDDASARDVQDGASVLTSLYVVFAYRGPPGAWMDLTERMLAHPLASSIDAFRRARLLLCAAGIRNRTHDASAAYDFAKRALDLTLECGNTRTEISARERVAVALAMQSRLPEALEEAAALERRVREPSTEVPVYGRVWALFEIGSVRRLAREREAAIDAIHRARELARNHDLLLSETAILWELGQHAIGDGDFAHAETHILAAMGTLEKFDDVYALAVALVELALVHQAQGRFDDAEAALERAAQMQKRYGSASLLSLVQLGRGHLRFEQGRVGRACEHYSAVLSAPSRDPIYDPIALAARTAAYATLGQLEDVARDDALLRRAATEAQHPDVAEALPFFRAIVELISAKQATAVRDDARADEHLKRASELTARRPSWPCAITRFAVRMYERVARNELVPLAPTIPPAPRALRLGPAAKWIESPSGERYELARHRAIRAILEALVRQRVEDPAGRLTMDELFDAAWTDPNVARRTRGNRVYVALSFLRKCGLQEVLLSDADGWRLDPKVEIERAAE